MKICIDPGHSGSVEPGACAGGLTEAALNLAIAKVLGEALIYNGYEVIFTREGDIEDDGLVFRADIANRARADIFLSIHCNAAENPSAYGVETYYYPGSIQGRKLADCIQKKLYLAGYTKSRGIKEADFAVLRLTDMPAVLIECGFITNEHDQKLLASKYGQSCIVAGIVLGIKTYLL